MVPVGKKTADSTWKFNINAMNWNAKFSPCFGKPFPLTDLVYNDSPCVLWFVRPSLKGKALETKMSPSAPAPAPPENKPSMVAFLKPSLVTLIKIYFLFWKIIFIVRVDRLRRFITEIFDDQPLELPWLDGLGLEPSHVNLVSIKSLSEIWIMRWRIIKPEMRPWYPEHSPKLLLGHRWQTR